MRQLTFKGCKYLDFSDHYAAKKEMIQTHEGVKVCWDRPVIDNSYPALVQFCKLRGRLNNPECCLDKEHKQCSDFEIQEHTVININD